MSALSENVLLPSPRQIGSIEAADGEAQSITGNDAPGKAQLSAGPVRLYSDAGDTVTASSKHIPPGTSQPATARAFPWLDSQFDKPCAILSPLNDL